MIRSPEMFKKPRPSLASGLLLWLAIFSLAGAPVQAAEPVPATTGATLSENPSMADMLAYAYGNNPQIAASRMAWRAEIERLNSESGYPDPQLAAVYFPEPIETRLGPQEWNLTLTQPIPFPGKLSKKEDSLAVDVAIAHRMLELTVRDILVAIQQSWQELGYIRTAQQIAEKNNALLEQLRKIAETANAEERGTLTDVIKAQSQAGQLRYDTMLLSELERTEIAKLNALLNRPPDALVGKLGENPLPSGTPPLEQLYRWSAENRQEVVIADLKRKKAALQHDLAKFSYLPDLKVGLFYAGIGMPDVQTLPKDAGRDALGIQAGMTIPLWFGKNSSVVAQATANVEKNQFIQDDVVNQSKAMIRELYFRLENSRRLVTLYQDNLLPQALNTLNAAETWSREGQGSLSDVIEAQATVYNFQLSLARATADYGKFYAKLEAATGVSLSTTTTAQPEIEGGTP